MGSWLTNSAEVNMSDFLVPMRRIAGLLPSLLLGLGLSPGLMAADSSSAAPKLTAAQIVEKNVAARGGLQAWRSVQTVSVTGMMDAGTGDSAARSARLAQSGTGATVKTKRAAATEKAAAPQVQLPFTLEYKRPNKSRLQIEFAGKTAIQVYDGANGWKVRPFLNRSDVEPFTPEEAKSQAAQVEFEGPLFDYAANGTKVQFEKIEPVEGHDAYKLKLTTKNGHVQHIWIDAHSFLDVKVDGVPRRMDGKMRDVWVFQRDFRSVQGVMMPFVLETAVDGYPNTHKMTIEKVQLNPNLADNRFSKPGGV
jgi:outer membrane lipoprotein-sorting protein